MRCALAGGILLVVGACTNSSGYTVRSDPSTSGTDPEPTTSVAPDSIDADDVLRDPDDQAVVSALPAAVGEPIVDGAANDLILVHDRDAGALASYRTDGSVVATYATAADGIVWHPLWSPDGRRVAFSRSTDGGATWELVTSSVDGSGRTTHALPGRPDYLAYDPTSSQVAVLVPSPDGFGLAIVDGDRPDTPSRLVDLGVPYFSDFSPEGDRLVAHVGADVRIVGVDGDRRSLDVVSLTHQAPAWHPTDDRVYYTADTDDGRHLVAHDLRTGETSALAAIGDFVLFDLDPTGERLAVSAFGPPTDTGVSALRRRGDATHPDVRNTGGWVVSTADGTATRLSSEPATAPSWDPTGTRVLVRDGLSGTGSWRVYGLDGGVAATDEIDLSTTELPVYVAFWDQYVRSHTLWSPDGEHFVHAGRDAEGRDGVWIHDAATSGPSALLTSGDVAFWSPT